MMKLKKILSLVLVVAMIASMLIVGAAAAETADEVSLYPEASAVMIGVGVIEGDEDGYRFTDGVSRAEAAAIICRILLGSTAETLNTAVAPFADVSASHWAAGYISYLKGQGIVSGVTDTTFDPTAPVTGVQFIKMMLAAVGYGKAGEFDVAAWDINTITIADPLGVFAKSKATDLGVGATREECMLYAFNVLTKVPTVNYNKTFESYYTGLSAINPVDTSTLTSYGYPATGDAYTYTLAWKNFALYRDGARSDDFGRPANSWFSSGFEIANTVTAQEPIAVLYGGVNSDTLYKTLGKTISESFNDGKSSVVVYVDGDNSLVSVNDPTNEPIAAGDYGTNGIASTGATTELYLSYKFNADGSAGYLITAVVTYEHIGEVIRVSKTKNEITVRTTEPTFSQPTTPGSSEADTTLTFTVDGDEIDITGLAKDDIVIYTRAKTQGANSVAYIADIAKAEPVVGTYVNTTSGYMNIDGIPVPEAKYCDDDTKPAVYGAAYEIYYDSQGNILYAEEYDMAAATGTYQYLFVNKVNSKYKYDTDLITGGDSQIVMEVIYAGGGKATVDYAITSSNGKDYITLDGAKVELAGANDSAYGTDIDSIVAKVGGAAHGGVTADTWYSYTVNDAGEVTLRTLTNNKFADYATAIEVEKGKPSTGITGTVTSTDFMANSDTVLTVIDADGKTVVYNGIANFPTEGRVKDSSCYVLVTHNSKTAFAKTITVYIGATELTANSYYAYVAAPSSYDNDVITYVAWIDGGVEFIPVKRENLGTGVSEYTYFSVCTYEIINGEYKLDLAPNAKNANFWYMDTIHGAYPWIEAATVDVVEDGFFTTTAIEDEAAWNESAWKAWCEFYRLDSTWAKNKANASVSTTYLVDNNTVIYDCVNGGIADELTSGDVFMGILAQEYDEAQDAWVDTDTFAYIWIVG